MGAPILGLTREESAAYKAAIAEPGAEVHTRGRVLDLDHKHIGDLHNILGGQLQWNRADDVATKATVLSTDIDDFDLRHLLQVEMGVSTDLGTLWCPVITGWVVQPSDTGYDAEYGLHDKMAMGLMPGRRGKANRNQRVGRVIRDMFEGIGETRFNIPRSLIEDGPKVGTTIHWGGEDEKAPTRMARRLAKRSGLQVFADQLGRITVRREPDQPAVEWNEDPEDTDHIPDARLLEPMTWSRDLTKIRNDVIGAGRKGLRARATAVDGYEYSPHQLRRGPADGKVPMLLTHRYTDESLDKQTELNDATEATLRRMSVERAEVQLTSSPVPWANVFDLLSARRRDGRVAEFRMVTGSLELDGGPMAVGYQRVMERPKRIKVRTTTRNRQREGGGRG